MGTVVLQVQARLGEKAKPLTVAVPPSPVPVMVDEARIGQVVTSLLDNAMRLARTAVSISLTVDGGEARIVIDDDGPGIPVDKLEGIFLSQTHKAVRPGGTGLGLVIARGLVAAHGGKVWAENRSDEGGHNVTACRHRTSYRLAKRVYRVGGNFKVKS